MNHLKLTPPAQLAIINTHYLPVLQAGGFPSEEVGMSLEHALNRSMNDKDVMGFVLHGGSRGVEFNVTTYKKPGTYKTFLNRTMNSKSVPISLENLQNPIKWKFHWEAAYRKGSNMELAWRLPLKS